MVQYLSIDAANILRIIFTHDARSETKKGATAKTIAPFLFLRLGG
jgi:hypothetical protein